MFQNDYFLTQLYRRKEEQRRAEQRRREEEEQSTQPLPGTQTLVSETSLTPQTEVQETQIQEVLNSISATSQNIDDEFRRRQAEYSSATPILSSSSSSSVSANNELNTTIPRPISRTRSRSQNRTISTTNNSSENPSVVYESEEPRSRSRVRIDEQSNQVFQSQSQSQRETLTESHVFAPSPSLKSYNIPPRQTTWKSSVKVNIIITLTNAQKYLPYFSQMCSKLKKTVENLMLYIYEYNSTDETKELIFPMLKEFSKKIVCDDIDIKENPSFNPLDTLKKSLPRFSSNELAIILSQDHYVLAESILDSLYLMERSKFRMITYHSIDYQSFLKNGFPKYSDTHNFKHPTYQKQPYLTTDIFSNNPTLDKSSKMIGQTFIYDETIGNKYLECESCFGGILIMYAEDLLSCHLDNKTHSSDLKLNSFPDMRGFCRSFMNYQITKGRKDTESMYPIIDFRHRIMYHEGEQTFVDGTSERTKEIQSYEKYLKSIPQSYESIFEKMMTLKRNGEPSSVVFNDTVFLQEVFGEEVITSTSSMYTYDLAVLNGLPVMLNMNSPLVQMNLGMIVTGMWQSFIQKYITLNSGNDTFLLKQRDDGEVLFDSIDTKISVPQFSLSNFPKKVQATKYMIVADPSQPEIFEIAKFHALNRMLENEKTTFVNTEKFHEYLSLLSLQAEDVILIEYFTILTESQLEKLKELHETHLGTKTHLISKIQMTTSVGMPIVDFRDLHLTRFKKYSFLNKSTYQILPNDLREETYNLELANDMFIHCSQMKRSGVMKLLKHYFNMSYDIQETSPIVLLQLDTDEYETKPFSSEYYKLLSVLMAIKNLKNVHRMGDFTLILQLPRRVSVQLENLLKLIGSQNIVIIDTALNDDESALLYRLPNYILDLTEIPSLKIRNIYSELYKIPALTLHENHLYDSMIVLSSISLGGFPEPVNVPSQEMLREEFDKIITFSYKQSHHSFQNVKEVSQPFKIEVEHDRLIQKENIQEVQEVEGEEEVESEDVSIIETKKEEDEISKRKEKEYHHTKDREHRREKDGKKSSKERSSSSSHHH
jgi:hypothetical protein